jgi:hypothetical protein
LGGVLYLRLQAQLDWLDADEHATGVLPHPIFTACQLMWLNSNPQTAESASFPGGLHRTGTREDLDTAGSILPFAFNSPTSTHLSAFTHLEPLASNHPPSPQREPNTNHHASDELRTGPVKRKKSQKNTHAAADSGLNFSIFEVLLLGSDVFILGLDLERE